MLQAHDRCQGPDVIVCGEERPNITFGDNIKGYTVGYGRLEIGNVVIDDIALVDGLQHNLWTVSQFNDKGFKVDFDALDCKIYHKKIGSLSLRGVRK